MRICYVVPWFPSLEARSPESQLGIFEYRQVTKLSERGNEFRVIAIKWRGQLEHEVIGEKTEIYRIASWFVLPKIRYPIPNFVALSRTIKMVCRDWKPDIIIYSHMNHLSALPILWLKPKLDIPSMVATDGFPGVSWFYGNRVVDGIGYLYSMLIGKRIFKLADGIQFMSSQLGGYAERLNIDDNKVFTMPRGVDTELFKPRNDQGYLRSELGIAESDIVILYVGRLDLVKGVGYLLQAAGKTLSKHNNIKFVMVGDGSLRREYESLAKPFFPNVIFTGWRNNIPQLMNIADMFVLPSLSEGAANVAMEASASGLPVIATEVGEVPQIVSDGETGMLIKPKDVDGLVEAMERLINNPSLAKKMGEAGRKRMEMRYTWEIICDKLEKAYQEVISKFNASKRLAPEVED